MQDIEYLTKVGLSAEKLRPLFETDSPSEKIKNLVDSHRDRIQRALDQNVREAPFYWAIDQALDAARKNLPHIQARELAASGKNEEEIKKSFELMGLSGMLQDSIMPDGTVKRDAVGNPVKCFNVPVFENVFVPLVANYRNIRLAKIYNDRNIYPRYKYTPARLTIEDMIVTEIVTSSVARTTADMGYGDDDKQSERMMLDYGWSLTFPQEPWYKEEYWTTENGKPVKKTQREGVRFTTPHPTRVFYDRLYHLMTVNSDTGVSYMGFWDIFRYKDLAANKVYWNIDKVSYGTAVYPFIGSTYWTAYQELYPCNVKFPVNQPASASGGAGSEDRLNDYIRYSSDQGDAAVTRVVFFEKLIPKDHGLADYDCPVWMRFVYADTGTCVYAEPIAYTPGYAMVYDYDFNRVLNTSLALDLTPFQQLLGNFLVQHFLSVKRNLIRAYWANNDIIPKQAVDEIRRLGDKIYTDSISILNYSKRADMVTQSDRREAITGLPLGLVSTSETPQAITMLLAVVERMLGYSPQEVGASASHEITAAEANITSANVGIRTEFIGTGVDTGINAKKRILYEAMYVYGSDEVFAEVADLTPERKKALDKLGFKIEEGHTDNTVKAGVRGKKGVLKLQSFISEREGINRVNDSRVGVAMLQMLGVAMQNEALFVSIGAPQFVNLLNYVLRMMGLPEDFRMRATKNEPGQMQNPEEIKKGMLDAIQSIQSKIVEEAVAASAQQVKEQLADPVQREMQAVGQALQDAGQRDQQLEAAIGKLFQNDQATQQAMAQLAERDQALASAIANINNAIGQLGIAANPQPPVA